MVRHVWVIAYISSRRLKPAARAWWTVPPIVGSACVGHSVHHFAQAACVDSSSPSVRTVEHFKRPASVEESSNWLGWLLFAVLLIIISGGLLFVVWSVSSSGGVETVFPEG